MKLLQKSKNRYSVIHVCLHFEWEGILLLTFENESFLCEKSYSVSFVPSNVFSYGRFVRPTMDLAQCSCIQEE